MSHRKASFVVHQRSVARLAKTGALSRIGFHLSALNLPHAGDKIHPLLDQQRREVTTGLKFTLGPAPHSLFSVASRANFSTMRRRKRKPSGTSDSSKPKAEEAGTQGDGGKKDKPHQSVKTVVTEKSEFQKASQSLLQSVQQALEALVPLNKPHMFVTKGHEEGMGDFLLVDLGPTHGQYTIQVDVSQTLLLFVSPVSGQHEYHFIRETETWCHVENEHDFKGLLVRDLIRQIQGVPNL